MPRERHISSPLIVRPGALGDAILTLPLVDALHASGGRVTVLGNPPSWRFLVPNLVECLDIDGREWAGLFDQATGLGARARESLRRFDFAAVLLGGSRGTAEASLRAAGIPHIVGADPPRATEQISPCTSRPIPFAAPWPPLPAHAASGLLSCLATSASAPSWPPALPSLDYYDLLHVTRPARDEALRTVGLAAVPPGGILAIHPGSGGPSKCWPAAHFAALAKLARDRLGLLPVFLIGPADEATWRALQICLPSDFDIRAMIGRPIREVLALLSLARAYVGNDSGVSHLAARACPTLALFGPSDPHIWHPLGPTVSILRGPNGRLADLPVTTVFDALKALL